MADRLSVPKSANEEVLKRIDALKGQVAYTDKTIAEAEQGLAGLRDDRATLAYRLTQWVEIADTLGLRGAGTIRADVIK